MKVHITKQGLVQIISDDRKELIAEMGSPNAVYRAHLLAAAPEMYELLKALQKECLTHKQKTAIANVLRRVRLHHVLDRITKP